MKLVQTSLIFLLLALPLAACAQESSAPAEPETADVRPKAAAERARPAEAINRAPAPSAVSESATGSTPTPPTRQYAAGEYYAVIQPPQPTDHPDRIEVMEVFSYACPHCFDFETYINAWLETKPDDVVFTRLPAIFNPIYENYARAYYTARALGILDDTHSDLFDAIHQSNQRFRSQEDLAAFYSAYGVNPDTYLSTANSFAVETKVNRAQVLAPRYGVRAVPTIIVNGKYRVQGGAPIRSYDELLDVVDYLVWKERQAMAGGDQAANG